jgi:phospholipid transport system substrate-binding protein
MGKALSYAWAVAAILVSATPVFAQAADPAAEVITTLDAGLLAIMHSGAGAGQAGRAKQIAPVIDRTFDIPLMTRLSVGPAWTGIAAKDQEALVAAFRAQTIAQYAKNFDSFGGEKFIMSPQVEIRGTDKVVRTTLHPANGADEILNYRLRQSGGQGGGQWKIIDVYFRSAISQLATKRSDYAAVLAKGGAPALIAHLNRLAANPK